MKAAQDIRMNKLHKSKKACSEFVEYVYQNMENIKRKQHWNSNVKVCIKKIKNKLCDANFLGYSVRHLS